MNYSQIRRRKKTPNALEFKHALKIVTMAQFLDPPKGHNYQTDSGGFLVDFLNDAPCAKSAVRNAENDEEFVLLFSMQNPEETEELSLQNEEELYNFAGYIVCSQMKQMKLKCPQCLKVLLATSEEIKTNRYCHLTVERDFTGNSLKYVSPLVFNEIFKPANELMSQLERSTEFITRDNCFENMVKIAQDKTRDVFPPCHNLRV